MTARILDGRRIAENLLDELKVRVDARVASGMARPGLAVVLVGGDPASAVYVRNKRRAAEKVGIEAFDYDLPAGTSEAQLLALIDELNADPKIHGILIQLPLPGIPDASRDTLFYPMITGKEGGTGLGRSIAQNLIDQHKGRIDCISWPGHTEFTIYLPLRK